MYPRVRLWCRGIGASLVLGAWSSGFSSEWPHFLGPHANGISDETELIDKFPTNGPPLLWEKKIGAGYSAPSVQDNRLVLQHRVADEEVVECLQVANGASLWRYAYP